MKKIIEDLIRWLSTHEISSNQAIYLISILIILFFSPLLFLGKILLNADSIYLAYPSAYFFSNFFGSPINNLLFSGYPVTAAFEYGYFHPLYNIFYYLFDFIFAYHSLLFLNFVGAGVFTYLFIRKIGLSVYASILSSLAYTFSQFSTAWLGVPSVSNAIFLLPALMYSVLQILDLKKKYVLLFGIILGLAFLGTHYQFIVISLICCGTFFIFEMVSRWNRNLDFITNIKSLLFLGVGFLVALIVSAPQTFSSMSFFAVSTRESILVYSSASHLDLFRYLVPTFNFPFISLDEFRPYIGVIPLFFGLVALYNVWKRNINERRAMFFSVFFLTALVASLKYSPFLFILKLIPLVKYFAVQSRWLYVGNFALIVLVGFGFDFVISKNSSFFAEKIKNYSRRLVVYLAVLLTLFNLGIVFLGDKFTSILQEYFRLYRYPHTTGLPIDHYYNIIEVLVKKVFYNVSFFNPSIVILFFSLVGIYLSFSYYSKKVFFSNIIIIFTASSLLLFSGITLKITENALITQKSQISNFLNLKEKGNQDYRLFGFAIPFGQYEKITSVHPEAEEEATVFAREALVGNINVFSEIPIVGGYNPMAFRRYQNIVEHLENTTAKMTTDEKINKFLGQLNLLSALNVKYIVSPYKLQNKDLDLVFFESVTTFEVPLYLYENKNYLPKFYLSKNVVFVPENNEKNSFSLVSEAKSSFIDLTFIECDNCLENSKIKSTGSVRVLNTNNRGLELEVVSERDEWLVVSNQAVPGWVAFIDGIPTRIYYANHAFQGIFVPKGKHTVTLTYSAMPTFSF